MDPEDNPFSPGVGSPPPALTGRDELIASANVAVGRSLKGRNARGIVMLGLRGVGKTVLLNHIEGIADERGCQTVIIEAPETRALPELLVPKLSLALRRLDRVEAARDLVRRASRALGSFAKTFKVGVGGLFEASVDVNAEYFSSGDLETDLPELFLLIGRAAKAAGRPVVILLDELQYLSQEDLSALIVALHRVSQRSLPVAFFGGGLPQLAGLAGEAKSYAERLFEYASVGPLGDDAARAALTVPVEGTGLRFGDSALDLILAETAGYPYFLQEWGKYCWDASTDGSVDAVLAAAARPAVYARLDEGFFNVRYDRMTPRERDYIHALASLGPGAHPTGDVAARLGLSSRQAGSTKNNLIKKGMVYSPEHGQTAFTVPLFDQFVIRRMGPRA